MRRDRVKPPVRYFEGPDIRTWDEEVRSLLGVPAVGEEATVFCIASCTSRPSTQNAASS